VKLKSLSISVIATLGVLLLLQGLPLLSSEEILRFPESLVSTIRNLSVVITVIFLISVFLRLTIKPFSNWFEEPEEKIFYKKIYAWFLYSLGFFFVLFNFGVSLGNLTLFVGLIATGLAFAVRDVLISYFAWLVLLRKKPFRIGDFIKIGDDEGRVLHIGTFYVLLYSSCDIQEDYIRVPNKLFLEKSIVNLGRNVFHERLRLQLAGVPIDKKERIETLSLMIRNVVGKEDLKNLYTDLVNDKLFLKVDYLVEFSNRQKRRSEVVDVVFCIFGDLVVLPKG